MSGEPASSNAYLPVNPIGSVRARTGFIFLVGLVLLVGTTLGVAVAVNGAINQASETIRLLDGLAAQVDQWTESSLSNPRAPLAGTADFEFALHGLIVSQPVEADEPVHLEFGNTRPAFASALQRTAKAWDEFFTDTQMLAGSPDDAGARQQVLAASAELHAALDAANHQLWLEHQSNTGMVRGLYAALFMSTIIFLLIGLWFTQQVVISQVEALDRVARRLGSGDLDAPVVLHGQGEFLVLARSFERMRIELREFRERTRRWTADLEAHVARRTQELSALSQVIAIASRSMEPETVLRTGLDQSLSVLGAETGGVWLVDECSNMLNLSVASGMSPPLSNEVTTLEMGEGPAGRAAQSGVAIVLEAADRPVDGAGAGLEGYGSLLAAPIKTRERVLGVLAVMTRQVRSFTPDEIALLTSIGQQIAVSMDSLRLMAEVRDQTQRVAALQERERIGMELHDGLLQTLGYLYLKLDQLEAVSEADGFDELAGQLASHRDVLERASQDVRRFISNLREMPPPRPEPLQVALREMLNEFAGESSLKVSFCADCPPLLLETGTNVHLVRIAREALVNASQHGHASRARLTLMQDEERVDMSVEDDGTGFEVDQTAAASRDHFGLSVMQARAAKIGGILKVESTPGLGTSVRVTWPLKDTEGAGH